MPQVSEALCNFLHARKTPTNADLIDRWSIDMETQVNVAAGNGEPVAGKRSTWSDGIDEWFNIRIPKNAATNPTFNDYNLPFPLDLHTDGIGMTGWRWSDRRSLWFGYDFDVIAGHATGIGVTAEELEKVKEAACALPYVEVRRSTGGKGIHLYVHFDAEGVPTQNHTEHAALARCILGMMSAEVGFDFASPIDACGHVMWVWHRKLTAENHGLEIIKSAEKQLSVADLPANWRDHIEVVRGRRSKIRVNQITEEDQDPFETLASSRKVTPLDESHKTQIEALMRSGFTTLWVADHHLLQSHTCALQRLFTSQEGKELGLVGIFKTISEGRDPGTPNCFLFPLPEGAWQVYRFTPGIKEAETWTQNGQNGQSWTTCYFNLPPDLATACTFFGGVEREKGGYVFASAENAIKTARSLGQELKLNGIPEGRKVTLKAHKDGRLVVQIKRETSDESLEGWDNQKGKCVKVFEVRTDALATRTDLAKQTSSRLRIKLITCAELDGDSYELDYLIENMLVAKQPCIVAGPKKALKTSILVALGIALATGERFLGQFYVKRPCKVIVLSGESGMATLQETARRICNSMRVQLSAIDNLYWSDFLPTFNDATHLDALDRMIQEVGCEVLIVDPAYLCMPGNDAGNLFIQGSLLRKVSDVCQRHGVGLILAHHTRKQGKTNTRAHKQPPELDDMAWAGFCEFARQWLLIGRRENFVPGSGEHKLWLSVGGSAGHSALWALDVEEGLSGMPRYWKVRLSATAEAREEEKTGRTRQRLLDAAGKFHEGETKSVILEKAKLKSTEANRQVFDALVNERLLIPNEVKKASTTYTGYLLSPEALKTYKVPA